MMDKFLGVGRDKFDVIIMIFFSFLVLLDGVALAYVVKENSQRAKEVAIVADTVLAVNCSQRTYAQSQVEHTANLLAASGSDRFWRESLVIQLERQREFRDTFKGLDCRVYSGSGPG